MEVPSQSRQKEAEAVQSRQAAGGQAEASKRRQAGRRWLQNP